MYILMGGDLEIATHHEVKFSAAVRFGMLIP